MAEDSSLTDTAAPLNSGAIHRNLLVLRAAFQRHPEFASGSALPAQGSWAP
jgi:hypothetical protein